MITALDVYHSSRVCRFSMLLSRTPFDCLSVFNIISKGRTDVWLHIDYSSIKKSKKSTCIYYVCMSVWAASENHYINYTVCLCVCMRKNPLRPIVSVCVYVYVSLSICLCLISREQPLPPLGAKAEPRVPQQLPRQDPGYDMSSFCVSLSSIHWIYSIAVWLE
jgi:hypothetical protein